MTKLSLDIAEALPITKRYRNAMEELPVCALPQLGGNVIDGYWLDEKRFFFSDDQPDPVTGRVNTVPFIFETGGGDTKKLIRFEDIQKVLGDCANGSDLGQALYDMTKAGQLAVTLPGKVFLVDLESLEILHEESIANPSLFSPDNKFAIFIKGNNLWIRDRNDGSIKALTEDGEPLNAYGQQAENGLSPLTYRAQAMPIGIWSKDAQWFLSHRIDERDLPEAVLVQHAPKDGGRPKSHSFKFSIVGDPLPTTHLVAFHVPSGRVMHSSTDKVQVAPPLVTKGAWFSDPSHVMYLRTCRFRKTIELVEWDLENGVERLILKEEAPNSYVSLNPNIDAPPIVRVLQQSRRILWWSQRDGWGHLYLVDRETGEIDRQLTKGAWQVRDVVHVDEKRERVIFCAGGMDPELDPGIRQLCMVNLDGTGLTVLAGGSEDVGVRPLSNSGMAQDRPFRPSFAAVGVSADGGHAVMRTSSMVSGAKTEVLDLNSGQKIKLVSVPAPSWLPRAFEALADDGSTILHGALFLPTHFDENAVYPVLDFVYPGPQLAWLPRAYGGAVEAQARAWAELGIVVVLLDTRGVPYRSRDLHQAGYGSQFEPQLADHVAVLKQLCEERTYLDKSRVGIIGTSGGGAASAYAMFNYPDVFKVGIAIAGNHDSRKYRSTWIDRYVGPVDLTKSEHHNTATSAKGLLGKLLLISGDMDENVPLSQTLSLVAALVAADKNFDLLIVPNEGHNLLITSTYAQRRIWDYLARELIGIEPPKDFSIQYAIEDIIAFARIITKEAG